MFIYANPKHESDPTELPNVELMFHEHSGPAEEFTQQCMDNDGQFCGGTGFYYWFCYPGCLPDSELFGPFTTQEEAIASARESYGED